MYIKKVFIILSFLITQTVYGQSNWFWRHQIALAAGASFGCINYKGEKNFATGLYGNICGVCVNASLGPSNVGENKYGPGSVMDTPCVDNFLFGYSCPVYSSSKNDPNKGFTLYISPMLGYVYERYKYSDKYYGHSVRADYNYYFSKGFLVNIAIKNKYMLYAKYNDVGFDIGFSMCLSMMRAVDWF